MANWNGYNVLTLPATPPAPSSIEFARTDIVAATYSPFTGQAQIFQWNGPGQNGFLEMTLTYPPMTASEAAAWVDFLIGLQGQAGVFEFNYLVPASANASGYWRLKSNTNKWSISEAVIYGLVLEVREAKPVTSGIGTGGSTTYSGEGSFTLTFVSSDGPSSTVSITWSTSFIPEGDIVNLTSNGTVIATGLSGTLSYTYTGTPTIELVDATAAIVLASRGLTF